MDTTRSWQYASMNDGSSHIRQAADVRRHFDYLEQLAGSWSVLEVPETWLQVSVDLTYFHAV